MTTAFRTRRRPQSTIVKMAALGVGAISAGLVVSAAVDVVQRGDSLGALLVPGLVGLVAGITVWRLFEVDHQMTAATALAAVAATWFAAAAWGSLPFWLGDVFAHPDDAWFEAVSGLSGTGSTVLAPIEGNSPGILFWRNFIQWFGGMGIVVLAVAVLPFLGVGGLELIRSESPGPTADRLAPRVAETARRLWILYVGFTIVTIAALMVVGLSLFDAAVHAFTTVSTGGFSNYDASIAQFDSVPVEVVLIVLTLAGGASFTLHWRLVAHRELSVYAWSADFRFYIFVFVAAASIVTAANVADGMAASTALRQSTFTVAALITSTGYGVADFTTWVPVAQLVLLFLLMTGGMTGSTSGGMKLLRIHVLVLHAFREARRARHPTAVLPLRLGRTLVSEEIVTRIAGFVLLYVLIGVMSVIVVSLLGADVETAIGAVATSMGNGGPGLGEAGTSFLVFTRPARVYLAVLMIVGRLEIFAVLVGVGVMAQRVRDRARRLASRRPPARPAQPAAASASAVVVVDSGSGSRVG